MTAGRATAESLPRKAFGITAPVAALALFLALGGLGAYRYLDNYWVYRGFAPTHDPAFVQEQGTAETIRVASPALGGRRQKVVVYLPPGYNTQPDRRYPVLYLLHGFPGDPTAFLHELRMGVIDDVYLADRRAQPLILVMPYGSTGIFTDKEWANGYRPHEDWETFLARDVVRTVDSRYRTIANRSGRAIAGLSEGGYGAFNIGFHHLNEFSVLESWSGYETADPVRSVFGTSDALLERNSPFVQLPRLASTLRRDGTYIWFYTGMSDGLRPQNTAFARALAARHLSYQYFVANGGHEWALWRRFAPVAYLVAAEHLH